MLLGAATQVLPYVGSGVGAGVIALIVFLGLRRGVQALRDAAWDRQMGREYDRAVSEGYYSDIAPEDRAPEYDEGSEFWKRYE
jgi:hypothetical protein